MTSNKHRSILFNDDGWILAEGLPPLTADDLRQRMVATYEQSPVGALCWSVGGHEVFTYETEVGERYGEASEAPTDQLTQNLRELIKTCGGPVTALVDLCHEAGIDFIGSVRMNEHYQMDPSAPNYGRFRRENPEWLIGRSDDTFAENSLEWGVSTGLNFAIPEVRSYMVDQICELFERFDADGVELDFMRHPTFFRPADAYADRHLMTDLVRTVRRRMDAVSKARDKHLDLAVRVPATLSDSARLGLDVRQWISDDLLDIVIAGGGFVPFSLPLEEFVQAAKGKDCKVYGCIEHLRLAMDDDVIRAIAARFWSAGADGIYLFNYFGKSPEWKRRVLNQIADPVALSRLDKRYHMDHTDRLTPRDLHDYPFRHAVPNVQLPVTLPETMAGSGPTLRLSIADDLETAKADGALQTCELRLHLDNASAEDTLELWLNGQIVSSGLGKPSFDGWQRLEWTQFPQRVEVVTHKGGTLVYDLRSCSLRQGENEFEIRLIKRTVQQPKHLVLRDVELHIAYQ